MDDWKELQIDNLPHDILTGDYEFEWSDRNQKDKWYRSTYNIKNTRYGLMQHLILGYKYRYRKPEPKAPSHEEIMTKWWSAERHLMDVWFRVVIYEPANKAYFISADQSRSKEWFIGCESATIPPEDK